MTEAKKQTATKQAKGSPINGQVPPADKQFGKPNGNPRHNGAWKKEDTLRYKWEQMLKLDEAELQVVLEDPKASRVEHMTAEILLSQKMRPSEKLMALATLANQVYGLPKQVNENHNIELKPILPMKKDEK